MASVIKLKRSSTSGSVPTTGDLQTGEVAVNLFDRKLYVSNGAGVTAIGGEDFRITSQDAGEGAYVKLLGDTTSTSNTVLVRGGTGITIGRDSNGSISVTATGDAEAGAGTVGTASIQDAAVTAAKIANQGLTANTYADNSIALGTKTTGNYVATVAAGGSGLSVSGSGSETASVTVSIDDNIAANTSGNAGTATTLATARTIGGVSFDGSANINLPGVNTTGNQDTSGNAGTATALETARNFTIAGDVTASAQSFDGTGNITLTTTLAADSVDGSNIADDSIDSEHYAAGSIDAEHIASGAVTNAKIASDAVTLGTQTTGNYVATVSGTSNEITVSGSGSETAGVTIGLPDDVTITAQLNVGENLVVSGNTSVGGNLEVSGDLTVSGGTTYLSTSTIYTDDGMFKLAANNAGDVTDTGIYGMYDDGGTDEYAGYFRDATDGVFKFYTGLQVEPTSTVNVAGTGYALAQVDAVIDGGSY